MRILFLNPGGDAAGGAERSLALLIGGLAQRGHEPAVITLQPGSAAGLFASRGATVLAEGVGSGLGGVDRHAKALQLTRTMRKLGGDALATARSIAEIASRYRPDVVHSNGLRTHVLTPYLARRHPVVWSLRERPAFGWGRRLVSTTARTTTAIAATSAFAAAGVSRCGRPVYIVPNPVEPSPPPSVEAARRALDLPTDRSIVGVLAHLHPTKGHHDAVAAWALLEQPRPLLILAGGDLYGPVSASYRRELEAQIDERSLGRDVRLLGLVADVSLLLAACDVVLHPAVYPEGFGRSVAEAQTAGVPVIATGIGGVLELIEDRRSGLVVPPSDPLRLAHAVTEVLGDDGLRRDLVLGGLDAAHRYAPAAHAAAFENVLRMAAAR